MNVNDIIKSNLDFLVKDYQFEFSYLNGRGENYLYKNKYGYFNYYEWEQFGEYEFSVKISNQESKIINFFEYYPKQISSFNSNHTGIKWLFKDKKKDYWKMIADLIKLEIANNHCLFGLKIFD